MDYKTCDKCKTKLPATTEYYQPCKYAEDKLLAWCKNCCRDYLAEHGQEAYKSVHDDLYYLTEASRDDRTHLQPPGPVSKIDETVNSTDKVCSKCEQTKPATLEHFGPDKCSKSGLKSQCRECERQWHREHRQTASVIASHKKYDQSKKGRVTQRRADSKYRQTEKYRQTCKRRRLLNLHILKELS